jgi:hypothetical protein
MLEHLPFIHDGCCKPKNVVEVDQNYEAILQTIVSQLDTQSKQLFYHVLFNQIVKDISKAFDAGFGRSLLRQQSEIESNFYSMMESNINRFSAAKTVAQVSDINRLVASGLPFNELSRAVSKINKQFNVDWLRTETSTAYATGLSSSEFIQKQTAFKYARWNQIQRDTKREAHSKLNGKIWETSKIPAIPPLDWNCGCRIEYLEDFEVSDDQVNKPKDFIDLLKASESGSSKYDNLYEQMKRYGFNKHKGKIAEVFDLNKTYSKEFSVDRLYWKTQGRKAFKDVQTTNQLLRSSKSYQQVKSTVFSELRDYKGRIINPSGILNSSNYKFIDSIHEVISIPSEVYLRQIGSSYRYTYLKFYNDRGVKTSLIVEAEMTGKGFRLRSLKKSSDPDRKRNGVNVFNSKDNF